MNHPVHSYLMLNKNKLLEELRDVEEKLEMGGATPTLVRKHAKILQRLYNPTIREKVAGVLHGGLTKEQSEAVQMQESIKKIRKLLED